MAFFRWLKAVVKQWWSDVTGGALVLSLALYSELSGVAISPRVYEGVVILALFQAMFLAWHEQERLRLITETKVKQIESGIQHALRLIDLEVKFIKL